MVGNYQKQLFQDYEALLLNNSVLTATLKQNAQRLPDTAKDMAQLKQKVGKQGDQLALQKAKSERALRGVKSKLKIAGQFQQLKSAQAHATLKSYIETSY